MTATTNLSAAERARRRQFAIDGKAASAMGVTVKARMRPMAVVEVDVAAERSSLVDAVIGPQVHLLVFDTAPEALEEHVIAPRALPSMLIAIWCSTRTSVKE